MEDFQEPELTAGDNYVLEVPTTSPPKLQLTDDELHSLRMWMLDQINSISSSLEGRWQKWQRYIRMYKAIPANTVKTFPWPNCSNVVTAQLASDVDTMAAYLVNRFFAHYPFINARVQKTELEMEDAEPLGKFSSYYFSNIVDLESYFRTHAPYLVLLGTHVVKEEISTDGLRLRVEPSCIPLHRFYAHRNTKSIQTAAFVADLADVAINDIVEWLQKGWITEDQFEGLAVTASEQSYREDVFAQHRVEGGFIAPNTVPILDAYVSWYNPHLRMVDSLRVVWDFEHSDILWVEPIPPDKRPYSVLYYRKDPDDFYGSGMADRSWTLQHTYDVSINQTIDNFTIVNTKVFLKRAGADLGNEERMYPSKVISVQNMDDIKTLDMGVLHPYAFTVINQIRTAFMMATEVSDGFAGQSDSVLRSRQTAMGKAMDIMQSSKKSELRAKTIESGLIDFVWKTFVTLVDYGGYVEDTSVLQSAASDYFGTMDSIVDRYNGTTPVSEFLSAMLRETLDEEQSVKLEESFFSLAQYVKQRQYFSLFFNASTENVLAERQAAMLLSQISDAYIQKIIGFMSQLSQLQQQGGPAMQPLVNLLMEAWKITNKMHLRTLARFGEDDVQELIVTLLEVQGAAANNAGLALPGVGQAPQLGAGATQGIPGAGSEDESGVSFSGVLGALGAATTNPSGFKTSGA